jgi:hypothetical protein
MKPRLFELKKGRFLYLGADRRAYRSAKEKSSKSCEGCAFLRSENGFTLFDSGACNDVDGRCFDHKVIFVPVKREISLGSPKQDP